MTGRNSTTELHLQPLTIFKKFSFIQKGESLNTMIILTNVSNIHSVVGTQKGIGRIDEIEKYKSDENDYLV